MVAFFSNDTSKTKDALTRKSRFSENAEKVYLLFNEKSQWTIEELVERTKMTTSAIRKIVQNLCKQRYIVKFGTTKFAFYRKMD